jgi:hypothetical protein
LSNNPSGGDPSPSRRAWILIVPFTGQTIGGIDALLRRLIDEVLFQEDEEDVVGEDAEVEEEDTYNDGPGNEEILVNTKEDEAEPG